MRVTARLLAGMIVGIGALTPWPATSTRAQATAGNGTPDACVTPLTLTLQPGLHFPGAQPQPIPDDLPPGSIPVALPLYPGAVSTQEQEELPTFSYPADQYEKSMSETYEAPAGVTNVMAWYRDAFSACGYPSPPGVGQSGKVGQPPLSYGIDYSRQDGRNTIFINLSLAAAKDGGTLVLYVVIALTPPDYPVSGSILRVPGTPVSVQITRYNGLNPGPHESRPARSVSVTDVATAASLADEINHLPKVTGEYHCPFSDNSHLTLVFADAGGAQHVVRIDLRGCQFVVAPPAPNGRVFDDPQLLPRILGLLAGAGSHMLALPFDARSLKTVRVRRLAGTSSRFLSTGQNGSNLLYLAGGTLFMTPAGGGQGRLLARGIADAAFATNDSYVLARPRSSHDLTHLLLIDTRTGKSTPFTLPAGAAPIGRVAGTGSAGLSDAAQCFLQYILYRAGNAFAGVNPYDPRHDHFRTARIFPTPSPGQLAATSCFGDRIAIYEPGRGLTVKYSIGSSIGTSRVVRRLPISGVSFLAWAPDDEHLAYRVGPTVFVLNVKTGASRPLLRVGQDAIEGAAWDPWSRVLALSVSPLGRPAAAAVLLANVSGKSADRLRLPFAGAGRLEWSAWTGTSLGITRVTAHGTQAWVATLPSLPPDPGASLR
jgi:hypothetical protein